METSLSIGGILAIPFLRIKRKKAAIARGLVVAD
jgi:hypothetical protein